MPIEWIGVWAVEGEEKLLKLPSGDVIRDHATLAEIEFFAEVIRLRHKLRAPKRKDAGRGTERDCQDCLHSKRVEATHRLCEHPGAPEKPPYKRDLHNALAYFAAGPPSWCPLEQETD